MLNKLTVSIVLFIITCLLIFAMYDRNNPLSIVDKDQAAEDKYLLTLDGDKAAFILNSDTFDINDKETLQYIGSMMNAEHSLQATGGFYDPKEENPQTIHNNMTNTDLMYKIIINADHGQYKVLPITKEAGKKTLISEIYGNMDIYKNGDQKDFNLHTYNGYKKDFDSPVVEGFLMSLIEHNKGTATVKGQITVDLGNDEIGKFTVYFGDQNQEKGGLVLGQNDIVKSGTIVLQYGSQVKEYLINNSLSSDDKDKLNQLKLFVVD